MVTSDARTAADFQYEVSITMSDKIAALTAALSRAKPWQAAQIEYALNEIRSMHLFLQSVRFLP